MGSKLHNLPEESRENLCLGRARRPPDTRAAFTYHHHPHHPPIPLASSIPNCRSWPCLSWWFKFWRRTGEGFVLTFKGNPGNEWQGRRPPLRPYICTTVSIFDIADMPFPLAVQGGIVFKLNSSPTPPICSPFGGRRWWGKQERPVGGRWCMVQRALAPWSGTRTVSKALTNDRGCPQVF